MYVWYVCMHVFAEIVNQKKNTPKYAKIRELTRGALEMRPNYLGQICGPSYRMNIMRRFACVFMRILEP
jgi:hypothetical protein